MRTHGHVTYKTREAKAYCESVRATMLAYFPETEEEPLFATGDVRLDLTWHRSAKRGDRSNRLKILEDALQGTVYADDKQIAAGWTERVDEHPTIPKGHMLIEVSAL